MAVPEPLSHIISSPSYRTLIDIFSLFQDTLLHITHFLIYIGNAAVRSPFRFKCFIYFFVYYLIYLL